MAAQGVCAQFEPFFNSPQITFLADRRRLASRAILKFCLVFLPRPKYKNNFCFLKNYDILNSRPTNQRLFLIAVFGINPSLWVGCAEGGYLSFKKINIKFMQKFFLYARKSTDVEDKQILSIEAQIIELRAFAKQEELNIIEELIEKRSAKIPGRPIFNAMLDRIEKGEANGIISWHPDRLARNSVDGGKIIYLLDCGHICALKFPQFWFEPTPQGKFMLGIAFGQSKYYVDNLSENTKRGLRQKVRRGEYPGYAPLGYLNDQVKHNIMKDLEHFRLVKKLFELYATGNYSMKDLQNTAKNIGLFGKSGKVPSVSLI